jgi:hypothetical protein
MYKNYENKMWVFELNLMLYFCIVLFFFYHFSNKTLIHIKLSVFSKVILGP